MDDVLFKALNNYFAHLTNVGYLNQLSTERLIVLCIIDDFLKEFKCDLTEEALEIINKALWCLYGSNCLISYPASQIENSNVNNIFSLNVTSGSCTQLINT